MTALHSENWRRLTSDQFILNTISGYEIEFESEPPHTMFMGGPISFSSLERAAIGIEICELLQKQAISPCERSPGDFISQIFARTKKGSDKLRVILNLRQLNKFVSYKHFKMESLDSIVNLVMRGDFFISIDLKDAYFSIPIADNHRKFLRFVWNGNLYQYNVLCFGLASAPRVFTKCMKPLITSLREKGYRISIYIDDLILMHSDPDVLKLQSQDTLELLQSLGFAVNLRKSHLEPAQEIEHLGFLLNSKELTVALPKDKKVNIIQLSTECLSDKNVTIRRVAKLIGCFNAYTTGTKWGRLFVRRLEREKILALSKCKGNYDGKIDIGDEARLDIRWWMGNEISIPKPMFPEKPVMTICSDASTKGWGAHNSKENTGGRWSEREAGNHINFLELKACFLALQCYAKKLNGVYIHVKLDNIVALSYIVNQGGVIAKLDRLANQLWVWCKQHDLWLTASHIRGIDNVLADEKSRIFHDNTEWSLCQWAFDRICREHGNPDVDLFASRLNNKVKNYCSWEADPHCLQVDAFTADWGKFDCCYAFPPFNLVGHVIQKMLRDKVRTLLLVCPKWPGQYWYPLLERFSCGHNVVRFGNSKDLLYLPYDTARTHDLWSKMNLCCFRLSYRR